MSHGRRLLGRQSLGPIGVGCHLPFAALEVEALMDSESLVESVCREIVEYSADRNAVLIFSSGVRHGNHIVDTLRDKYGIECGFVINFDW